MLANAVTIELSAQSLLNAVLEEDKELFSELVPILSNRNNFLLKLVIQQEALMFSHAAPHRIIKKVGEFEKNSGEPFLEWIRR